MFEHLDIDNFVQKQSCKYYNLDVIFPAKRFSGNATS